MKLLFFRLQLSAEFFQPRKNARRDEPFVSRVAVGVINFAFYLLVKAKSKILEKNVGFIDVSLLTRNKKKCMHINREWESIVNLCTVN